ncbi:MAG: prenyltransferase [bacterium ADurb.Bin212]|nr:MAG: prenyltransferase [bacterium ADurb.Bin212]
MPVIFVISIALIVTLLIDKGTIVIISALLLLLIGISYTLFFKGLTKSVVGFKNYYVALTYVSIIIYTAIYHSAPLNSKLIILTMFFAMRWFINTAFCDIKDIAQDKNEGLKTLPVVLGQKSFLFTLGAINALSVIPLMVGVATGILPPSILFLVIVVPYYYYYSSLINNKKTDLQKITNVWADGEVLLWLVAAL